MVKQAIAETQANNNILIQIIVINGLHIENSFKYSKEQKTSFYSTFSSKDYHLQDLNQFNIQCNHTFV